MKNNTKLNLLVIIAIVVLLFVSSSASSLPVPPFTDDFSNGRLTSQEFPSHGNSTSTSSNTSNEETPPGVMPLSIPKITDSSFSLEGYGYSDPWYSSYIEPAPMGIGFIGLGPNGQVGPEAHEYNYSTPSLLGIAKVSMLSINKSAPHVMPDQMTFQLNVVLGFYNGNASYNYWVQDVVTVNTLTNTPIVFDSEIWNITLNSSGLGQMLNSTVIGNGSVNDGVYGFVPQNIAGESVSLAYPYWLEFKVNTTVNSEGYPVVKFYYDDEFGWIEYDSAIFVFAKSLEGPPAFVIGGAVRNGERSSSLLYDAGLVLAGPGGGTNSYLKDSNVSLELEYWNGHNYQMPPFAYNFAPDTAEGVGNASVELEHYENNGSLEASVTNGPGEPGLLYYFDNVSTLEVNSHLNSGTLFVNNTPYYFVNGTVNLTLIPCYPGYYRLQLFNNSGQLVWSTNVTLYPGQFMNISATNLISVSSPTYSMDFKESGLPNGNYWSVTLIGTTSLRQQIRATASSTTNSITFNEPNGTYSFVVSSPIGNDTSNTIYAAGPKMGILTLKGERVLTDVHYETQYYLDIASSPSGGGTVSPSSGYYNASSHLTIRATPSPNYEFIYWAGDMPETYSKDSTFVITMNAPTFETAYFVEVYEVTFTSSGMPLGIPWYVNLTSQSPSGKITSSSWSTSLPNGTYSYSVSTGNKIYKPSYPGTFTVNGAPVSQSIAFSEVTYTVTFSENGLLSGSSWSVTLSGKTESSVGNISFSIPNGTYPYSIASIPGYSIVSVLGYNESSGYLTVDGYNLSYPVTFVKVTSKGFLTGSIYPLNASIWINGTIYHAVNGQFNISLSPGTYEIKVSDPGYSTYTTNITVSSSSVSRLPIQSLTSVTTPSSFSFLLIIVIAVIIMAAIASAVFLLTVRNRKGKS